MQRLAWLVVAGLALAGMALAAAPAEETVQGIYEGARKVEARVVACGKGTYKVFVRQPGTGDKVDTMELDGKTEGDAVAFAGKVGNVDWTGTYAAGAIKLTSANGAGMAMKRVVRKSPTLGAKPPAGAIVILGDKKYDGVTCKPNKDGTEQEWVTVDGGGIRVPKGGMNSKDQVGGSFRLHVEFKCPFLPDARDQGRGNSGCYLPNGEEIQVLDSFGMTSYTGGGCGGIYKYKDPDAFDKFSLASLPPLQWQTYDIEYRVRTKDGQPTGKPRITVLHNGIKIHDNFELQKDARKGGFHWQDHGNPVHYRNIWVVPLPDK